MVSDLKEGKSRYLIVPHGAFENPRELGLTWALRPIAEHYRLLAQTAHYEILSLRAASEIYGK